MRFGQRPAKCKLTGCLSRVPLALPVPRSVASTGIASGTRAETDVNNASCGFATPIASYRGHPSPCITYLTTIRNLSVTTLKLQSTLSY